MSLLIACLGTGKGTWNNINEIINHHEWEEIYLITNEFGKQNYKPKKQTKFVIINPQEPTQILRDKIIHELKELTKKIGFQEVAININSGTGKEHTAIISALIKLGVGIRFIDTQNKEIITL